VFVERDIVGRVRSSSSSSLYVARVPPVDTQVERVQSMDLVVKEVRSFIEGREGKGDEMQRSAAARVDLGVIYLP
jgi:hypothetical protein